MLIKGLQKLTLLDYPDKLACTVFLGGCNFRCPFCHNASLVRCDGEDRISTDEFFAFLESRRSRLDGVCVSGGEPTLNKELVDFIRRIKEMGFLVKLDTNGSNPDILQQLIDENLLDYVAMDIKGSRRGYYTAAGIEDPLLLSLVKHSVHILKEGRVDYEFRTTLVRELHAIEDFHDVGEWLQGDSKYYLQTYRNEGDLLVGGFTAFTPDETKKILEIVKNYLPNAQIRS